MATSAWHAKEDAWAHESTGGASELGLSERKRKEVGLSPRRPTANTAPQRPPSTDSFGVSPAVLPGFLGVIVVATIFLVLANIGGWFPRWWHAPAIVADTLQSVSAPQGNGTPVAAYQLALSDDFSAVSTMFPEGTIAGEWRVAHAPTSASYLMEVWPNHIVWSLLDLSDTVQHRTQASMSVATHTPWGYAGLVNRYTDENNFYLFLVDGQGRYTVQMQREGELNTLLDWTPAEFLNNAGSTNTLTIDDDGAMQRFYGNSMLLFEAPARLPIGDTGLVGGAMQDGVAEISFDWVQLFDLLTD